MNEETSPQYPWLIADIGATSSRCALLTRPGEPVTEYNIFSNDKFVSVSDLLCSFLSAQDQQARHSVLAVAAPIHGEDVQMCNREWQFNSASLASDLGLDSATILNDFHALAYALPVLDDTSRVEIGGATEYRDSSIAVLGPGSGLGMSAWIGSKTAGTAMSGEGGHITMASRDESEDKTIRILRERFGHCSAERILSGPGLVALHNAMHDVDAANSEEITTNTGDARCAATMDQFFKFLGSAAADLALISGAFGGVYIAGGIVPACIDQLVASPFRERFEDKNRYREYMQRIPTYVVTDPVPGLQGLSAYIGGMVQATPAE